jgi:hypothetical protein
MTDRMRWLRLAACALATIGGCCILPTPGLDDYPGVAPALHGTWEAISDNQVAMVVFFDATGDPVTASITGALIGDELAASLPGQILLDGRARSVNVPDVPVSLTYVGIARASKSNPSLPIAVGESITVVVELRAYTGATELARATITYTGRFVETFQADGSVRAIVDVSSSAQQIAQGLGLDLKDEDIALSGVLLTKQ